MQYFKFHFYCWSIKSRAGFLALSQPLISLWWLYWSHPSLSAILVQSWCHYLPPDEPCYWALALYKNLNLCSWDSSLSDLFRKYSQRQILFYYALIRQRVFLRIFQFLTSSLHTSHLQSTDLRLVHTGLSQPYSNNNNNRWSNTEFGLEVC